MLIALKEAIEIRKPQTIMNRDEGQYYLSHIYDELLVAKTSDNSVAKQYGNSVVKNLPSNQNAVLSTQAHHFSISVEKGNNLLSKRPLQVFNLDYIDIIFYPVIYYQS